MLHNHPPEAVTENFKSSLTTNNTFCGETLNAVTAGVNGIPALSMPTLDEPIVADLTKEFLQTFGSRSFDSFQDLLGHMNSFMKVLDLLSS